MVRRQHTLKTAPPPRQPPTSSPSTSITVNVIADEGSLRNQSTFAKSCSIIIGPFHIANSSFFLS
jgi:hypothetical protein